MRIQFTADNNELNKVTSALHQVCSLWNIPVGDIDEAVSSGRRSFEKNETRRFPGGRWTASVKELEPSERDEREYTLGVEVYAPAVIMGIDILLKLATAVTPIVTAIIALLTSMKAVSLTAKEILKSATADFNENFVPTKMMAMTTVVDETADVYDIVFILNDGFCQYRVDSIRHIGKAIPEYTEARIENIDMSKLDWGIAKDYYGCHNLEINTIAGDLHDHRANSRPAESAIEDPRTIIANTGSQPVKNQEDEDKLEGTVVTLEKGIGDYTVLFVVRVANTGSIVTVYNLTAHEWSNKGVNMKNLEDIIRSLKDEIYTGNNDIRPFSALNLNAIIAGVQYYWDNCITGPYDDIRKIGIGTLRLKGELVNKILE